MFFELVLKNLSMWTSFLIFCKKLVYMDKFFNFLKNAFSGQAKFLRHATHLRRLAGTLAPGISDLIWQ